MKYELLQTLLPYLEEYERTYPQQAHTQHFGVWLARRAAEEEQVATRSETAAATPDTSSRIQHLLVFLNRYARGYAKKALDGSVLGGIDEYVYLTVLSETGGLTKSELIYRNRHEKPTGMEIIRRLLTAGLVVQSDDPDDRRSKQLRITEAGRAALEKVGVRMNLVREITTGNLNSAEKLLLLQILEKLESFHQLLLARTRGGDFEEMIRVLRLQIQGKDE